MADKKQSPEEGGRELRQHPLIERLTADASAARPAEGTAPQPPAVNVLSGFPAHDPEAGYWRIYVELDLQSYVRVAEADIVGTQTLATDEAPLRPSVVWIRRGAELEYTRVETRQLRAGLLQGGFVAGLGGVAPGVRGLGGAEYWVRDLQQSVDPCPSVDWCRTRDHGACFTRPANCRSEFGICGGPGTAGCSGPICPTGPFVCGPSAGCTWGPECGF
jgi:hypothetical protein